MTDVKQEKVSCREAEECLKTGRYQEAIDIYRTLAAASPGEESLSLALAWACHDAGRLEEAISCFEQLFDRELSRKIFTGFAYDELVRIYKTGGRYDRLVDVCERAAQAQPNDPALLGEWAAACLKAGMIGKSIEICEGIIALDPEATATYCLLGESHLAAGEFALAEKAFHWAAKIDPAAACAFYGRLAENYLRLGEQEKAEKFLRKCLKMSPRDALLLCRLGDCLIGQGKLMAARRAYEKAVSLSPGSTDVLYLRWGQTLASARYHREAITVLRRALKKGPPFPLHRIRMAESFVALGMNEMAAQTLSEINPWRDL